MKEYLKLAWRNIWRNKRRTLITTASVFFALFFALVMRSMQVGIYAHWTNSIVEAFTGSIQIHKNGYWKDPTIDNTFEKTQELVDSASSIQNVKSIIPRLESFALASTGEYTKGVMVVGIDPEKEKELTNPEKNLEKGEYLNLGDDGILISSRLAEYLKVDINDTVTLIGQGFHGITAAGIYPVTGIIKLPNPELDRRIIFMPLPVCQYLYGATDMLTSIIINVHDPKLVEQTVDNIENKIDLNYYEIMDWKELNKELVQQINSDKNSAFLMLGLLYLIVGFGVLGTLIMMITERKKEFGVMVAVGMRKTKLGFVLLLEMLILGLIGIFTSIMASLPLIMFLNRHPILMTGESAQIYESYGIEPLISFGLERGFFIGQSTIVLVIFLISIVYPIISTIKIKEAQALRA